ncbi:hypothetical protein BN863_28950 [Formosa agariphila KMM 3901]|uniref:Uncharacterized protein n=1 Tax=Formosa agariphila (strain DSM 15362 / KCTC 12365 / LMG 23005 / KMM 3901 / M-2Alg 35-1) TaxID=1347342 RepID=T2KP20_FORAG|nr:hypothetical protein [Formosa agariphila]CDF80607.1 hypothetical protein BN863_28950 [Formosa agariphila KMM 3901]
METNPLITQILKIDYRSYDDYRFSCFFKWCSLYSELGVPLQALTTSKALYSWYCQQWLGLVEKAFKNDCKPYLDAKIQDAIVYLDFLSTYPEAIEGFYPSVLINKIKNDLKPLKKECKHTP